MRLNCDYFKNKAELDGLCNNIIYTGCIDEYYNYCYGPLEYRTVYFETEKLNIDNYQGNAVVNYTDIDVPYTRIIEHKDFEFGNQSNTIISKEYSKQWNLGDEPYYPVNNEENQNKYSKYLQLAKKEKNVIFGGRLAEYKYYDMHNVIRKALDCVSNIINNEKR